MVHVVSFSGGRPIAGLPVRESQLSMPVKLEVEDQLEDEHGPYNKRMKPDHPSLQEVDVQSFCAVQMVKFLLQNVRLLNSKWLFVNFACEFRIKCFLLRIGYYDPPIFDDGLFR